MLSSCQQVAASSTWKVGVVTYIVLVMYELTLAATSMTQVPLGFSPQLCTDLILHSLSPFRLSSDARVSSRSDLVPVTNRRVINKALLLGS